MADVIEFRAPGRSCRLALVCRPAPDVVVAETLIFDPPWDDVPDVDVSAQHVIAFTDAQFFGDVLIRFGSPSWVFTWDAVSCFNLPRRPLKRAKYALWYGDAETYDYQQARNDRSICKNPRGVRLMDVYQEPLAHVYRRQGRHAKPLTWMRMLIGNCTQGAVTDLFGGTGTSLLACADLGRDCTVYEINADAQRRIVERAQQHGLEVL